MSARLIIVAAVDSKNGVGKDGGIPWRAPQDLRRFRALTLGGAVVYGRRTWESLPPDVNGIKLLEHRYNILLTKKPFNPLFFDHNGTIANSLYEALHIVEAQDLGPLFVVGGRQVWQEAFELVKQHGIPALAYITKVEGNFECDTFFPSFLSGWTLIQDNPPIPDALVSTKFQVWSSF